MTDRNICEFCLDRALKYGSDACRVNLNRVSSDIFDTLNGETDSVNHTADRSLSLSVFADGRNAVFSTNRLEEKDLDNFVKNAVQMTRLLGPDPFKKLPDSSRYCQSAVSGDELGLRDPAYTEIEASVKRQTALAAAIFGKIRDTESYRIISEEGEYSDSLSENLIMDSAGLYCFQRETSFDYATEVSIEDPQGHKYSAYSWDSATHRADLDPSWIGADALRKAAAMIGSSPAKSGRYTLVAHRDISSRLFSPILSALNGYSLQQHSSFLDGALGQVRFGENLTVIDDAQRKGESGSRLFDSEGVSVPPRDTIISEGRVMKYFLNTCTAGKMGLPPTVSDYSRARLMPLENSAASCGELLAKCGNGILVTGFVGGNCNSVTGDFSYGVNGFLFSNGKIERPVSGMLITGNMISLWNSLISSANDCRPCQANLIPSLAFEDVSFSG